jgi:hypothetical protein
MNTEPEVGQVVRVTAKFSGHDYLMNAVYVVVKVDTSDSTLVARGPFNDTGGGDIRWDEVEPVAIGWDFCKAVLPEEVITVLSACKGIEAIALRGDVKDAILKSLPDLRERIHAVMSARKAQEGQEA